jgi:hypothetical protein
MGSTEGTNRTSPLLTLPNELFIEVTSRLDSFKDLNAFLRTSRLFYNLFNTHLYRRAVTSHDPVREDIVRWVIDRYRVTSLALLLDNGLSVHQELGQYRRLRQGMLHIVCELLPLQELSVPLARLLIERGADIHPKKGTTYLDELLHVAAHQSRYAIAKLLLEKGVDVNAKKTPGAGWTPLHVAIMGIGDRPAKRLTVKLLLQAGADVNAIAADGRSPLWHAYAYDRGRLGTLLLAHGADTGALYSRKTDREELVRWLKRRAR